MANKIEDMETLLEITSELGNDRSIKINPQKSGVMVLSRQSPTHMYDPSLTIQGRPIQEVESYKYFGIEPSAEKNYIQIPTLG